MPSRRARSEPRWKRPTPPSPGWVDKPVGVAYGPFLAGLRAAIGPRGVLWQRRLSLGPAREFCLWLPGDGLSLREVPATALPPGSLIVRGTVVASSPA